MSLADSYVLASKVRAKLTKDANDPKSSLRSLVVQANMLDSLLDHITVESRSRAAKTKVSFKEPIVHHDAPTQVVEYEVEDDSDSDSDSDFDSDSDYEFEDDEVDEVVCARYQTSFYDSSESDPEDDDEVIDHITYKQELPSIVEEPEPFTYHSHASAIDLQAIPRSFNQDELESKIMNHSLFKPHSVPVHTLTESYSMKLLI